MVCLTGCGSAGGNATSPSFSTSDPPATANVLLAYGEDRLPNETPKDWVTYADDVAVVTVTGQKDVDIGDATSVGRRVTLRVEKVLWSGEHADAELPKTFTQLVLGWKLRDGDVNDRQKIGTSGTPRLEVGHTYISAYVWESARCAEGDGKIPAGWRGLGTQSTLPYDDNTVGVGELEGTTRGLAQARAAAADTPVDTVGALTFGKSAASVQQLLAKTTPGKPKQFAAVQSGSTCE